MACLSVVHFLLIDDNPLCLLDHPVCRWKWGSNHLPLFVDHTATHHQQRPFEGVMVEDVLTPSFTIREGLAALVTLKGDGPVRLYRYFGYEHAAPSVARIHGICDLDHRRPLTYIFIFYGYLAAFFTASVRW
jgi:hypothetical protein